MHNLISMNNGNTFITAEEALQEWSLADIVHYIDLNDDAYMETDTKYNGDTDVEWLNYFLDCHFKHHNSYFVIG
jgi:hypothetical protein